MKPSAVQPSAMQSSAVNSSLMNQPYKESGSGESGPGEAGGGESDGLLSQKAGKITLCDSQDCGRTCCDFAQGNYILFYPGELREAIDQGLSVGHLDVVDDGQGGHRAICRARHRQTCDDGYKPLDCASYPFFPRIDEHGNLGPVDKGTKCPLPALALGEHKRWAIEQWSRVLARLPRVRAWLRTARLVGYERSDGSP